MIAEVVFGLAVNKAFDYDAGSFPALSKGMRVWVDFNHQKLTGIVINTRKNKPSMALKPIINVLDDIPAFPANLLELSKDIASKYLYSQGEILEIMLPAALRTNRRLSFVYKESSSVLQGSCENEIVYIREHLNVNNRFLRYKEIILQTTGEGKQVIICVPQKDIAYRLKNFLHEHIKDINIALLFGTLKVSSQLEEWSKIRGQMAQVSIGTRFAIFSPFVNLGAIIVEKENFYGYFQPQKPFYHLRDLALMRAKKERARLILHSDFPSLQVYRLLKHKKARLEDLSSENNPKVKIFNLKDYKFRNYPVLSDLSKELVRKYLEDGKKVIIFWNRKGFGHMLRCGACGFVFKCAKCEGFLTFSKDNRDFVCNRCMLAVKAKTKCPKCHNGYIRSMGLGIEKVELNYRKVFPDKRIVVLSKQAPFQKSDWDILITTEKLVFLEDLPSADLIIVSGLDFAYSLGDYSSSVELFFLLQRLKNLASKELIIFTFSPSYYPVSALLKDWGWFYSRELKERKALQFPPYWHVAKVVLRQKDQNTLLSIAGSFRNKLEGLLKARDNVSIYGPLKDIPFRSAGKFHYFLFIKAKKLGVLKKVLDKTLLKFKKSSVKISLIIQ